MRFKLKGSNSSGHAFTESNVSKLTAYDLLTLTYETSFKPFVDLPDEDDTTTRLLTNWFTFTFYNGNEIFSFNSTQTFYISDLDVDAEDSQLIDILKTAFKIHQEASNNRRKEFTFLPYLEDTRPDTISQLLPLLRLTLHDGLQQHLPE